MEKGAVPTCGVCYKVFTRTDSLKRHMQLHTGRTYHNCDVCGALLSRLCHLKSHMIVHTEKTPSADSRRAVVSFWRKNVHATG